MDITLDGVSLLDLTRGSSTAFRPGDIPILELLVRSTMWGQYVTMQRAIELAHDPAQTVICDHLGGRNIDADILKNGFSRGRRALSVGGLPGQKIIRHDPGRGYRFDQALCIAKIAHVWQV